MAMDDNMMNDPASQGGYEICIRVGADKQISVGVESAEEDPAAGQPEQEGDYAPAASIGEALSMAGEIFRNGGAMPDQAAGPDAQTDAMAGYKRKAAPQMSAPDPTGIFGE